MPSLLWIIKAILFGDGIATPIHRVIGIVFILCGIFLLSSGRREKKGVRFKGDGNPNLERGSGKT